MNLSNKNASHTCLFEINQNKFFLLVTILFCLFQFLLHVRTLEHKIVVGMDFVTIKIVYSFYVAIWLTPYKIGIRFEVKLTIINKVMNETRMNKIIRDHLTNSNDDNVHFQFLYSGFLHSITPNLHQLYLCRRQSSWYINELSSWWWKKLSFHYLMPLKILPLKGTRMLHFRGQFSKISSRREGGYPPPTTTPRSVASRLHIFHNLRYCAAPVQKSWLRHCAQ